MVPEKLSALARLFADDTAVYKTISNGHDQAQLQEDLQWLADWEESWDMEFHPVKCLTGHEAPPAFLHYPWTHPGKHFIEQVP